jgi:hypothetical protein
MDIALILTALREHGTRRSTLGRRRQDNSFKRVLTHFCYIAHRLGRRREDSILATGHRPDPVQAGVRRFRAHQRLTLMTSRMIR